MYTLLLLLLLGSLLSVVTCVDVCSELVELRESGQLSSPRHPSPAPPGPQKCHCTIGLDAASLRTVRQSEPGDWRLKVTARQVVLGCEQTLRLHTDQAELLNLPAGAGKEDCNAHVQMSPSEIGFILPDEELHVKYESRTKQRGGKFALYYETVNFDSGVRNLPLVRIECSGNEEKATTATTITYTPKTEHQDSVNNTAAPTNPADSQETRDSESTFILVGVICGVLFALLLLSVAILLYKRRSKDKHTKKTNEDCEEQHNAPGDVTWNKDTSVDKRTRVVQVSESEERDSAYRSHNSSHCSLNDSRQHSPVSSAGYCDESVTRRTKLTADALEDTERRLVPSRGRGHSAPHKVTAKDLDPLLHDCQVEGRVRLEADEKCDASEAEQTLLNRVSKISTV